MRRYTVRPTRRSARAAGALVVALLAAGAVWGGLRLLDEPAERSAAVEVPATSSGGSRHPADDPDEPAPETPATTPGTEPTADDPGGDGAAHDTLPDGEHFGFVSFFTGDALELSPAGLFTGDEAVNAAREDGEIGPGDDLPNPFYIRYPEDTSALSLPVAVNFEASMLDNVELESRQVDATGMAALYAGEADDGWVYGPLETLPMIVLVEHGEVVRAEQRYLP